MFDISFAELMVMAVVALLVIGPEKLPKVARTVGAFAGRLQRYVADVKDEISREARFEDLKKLQAEIKAGAQGVESSIMAGVDAMTTDPETETTTPKKKIKKTAKKAEVAKKATAKKIPVRKVSTKSAAAKKVVIKKPKLKKTATKKPGVTNTKSKTVRTKASS